MTDRDLFPGIIGNSPALKSVLELIDKVARTDSTVLIYGESGVGKELVARAIHRHSLREEAPFIVIDCTSLHEELLESELFGHEKGAYTSAVSLKHGLFEAAHTGTVFMDEIGEISPTIQSKLLRVLETGSFRRVGGTTNIQVNVRLLAATNKNLQQLMVAGKFKEELFYRLNVFSLFIPPLRNRQEDIPILARHFAAHSRVAGKNGKRISDEAMRLLVEYHWPGNVRELENAIERAAILSEGDLITPKELSANLRDMKKIWPERGDGLPSLKEIERRYIERVLQEVNGHRGKAAEVLGISERNLYRKIKEYEIGVRGRRHSVTLI